MPKENRNYFNIIIQYGVHIDPPLLTRPIHRDVGKLQCKPKLPQPFNPPHWHGNQHRLRPPS